MAKAIDNNILLIITMNIINLLKVKTLINGQKFLKKEWNEWQINKIQFYGLFVYESNQ